MAEAKKTDPELWEEVKEEVKESDKGGDPGQWSARKAQLAVQKYKKRGGGYEDDGPDQDETDLHEWTEEDWGTKSGGESGETGERYLPKKVRMLLTEDEYARSTKKKKNGDGQYVDQPDDVKEKVSKIKDGGPTKEMLMERAEDLEIEGRSSMTKDELLDAIEDATDENGRKKGSENALQGKTKEELYDMAQDQDIDGRSDMSKDELIEALNKQSSSNLSDYTKEELYEKAKEQDVEGRSKMDKGELAEAVS
ncbi:Rho termination factor N-terminal domain-containing protein [Parvularcula maris]|uniref:Rho termination factor N-terminal domain-containing protein n=1 Tax=Parvularcula maris TaxID=2965077 RepID=A0A9X2RGC0_9PROT|nr:Rho termination factor N-terminal domain-containing protein [Parvularcula maris]MCQ8183885.1 Rho termination factor N-terminal domain-containing protein [Parvularcula maris]